MLGFSGHFGTYETSSLKETFRFDDKLSDFSTKFILRNPNQMSKSLESLRKSVEPSISLVEYDGLDKLRDVLRQIHEAEKDSCTVFIIGRYNFQLKPKRLYELQRDFPRLSIEYLTAHRSKGREADYVIVIGLRSGRLGFPCQIADDPILSLVMAKEDPHPNAEERRLFYVAVTRAKKHVYLLAGQSSSSFILEIERDGYELSRGHRAEKIHNCPKCGSGKVVSVQREYGGSFSCSNYPYCDYEPRKCPQCKIGFLYEVENQMHCSNRDCAFTGARCPQCDGYLVLRNKYGQFYGCSNYPRCRFTKRIQDNLEQRYRRRY
jgi:DNA helicase-4